MTLLGGAAMVVDNNLKVSKEQALARQTGPISVQPLAPLPDFNPPSDAYPVSIGDTVQSKAKSGGIDQVVARYQPCMIAITTTLADGLKSELVVVPAQCLRTYPYGVLRVRVSKSQDWSQNYLAFGADGRAQLQNGWGEPVAGGAIPAYDTDPVKRTIWMGQDSTSVSYGSEKTDITVRAADGFVVKLSFDRPSKQNHGVGTVSVKVANASGSGPELEDTIGADRRQTVAVTGSATPMEPQRIRAPLGMS
jgi:hypothetical protein